MAKIWLVLGKNLIKSISIKTKLEIIYTYQYDVTYIIITCTAYSCLPTWSNDNIHELAYVWYVCLAGGIIPAFLMVTTNIYVVFASPKVSMCR